MAPRKSLGVYHLFMGGGDTAALEWEALFTPRFFPRLQKIGVTAVYSAAEADVLVVTGSLTQGNLDAVLAQISQMPQPSLIIAAGDDAVDGGLGARAQLPGLAMHPLSHYVDVNITVPGNPPTPQSLIAALGAAATWNVRGARREM